MQTTNKTKRGRPTINIQWPDSVFTVKDVLAATNGTVSNVTVQLRINKEVEKGILTKVGKSEKTNGRPRSTYLKIANQPPEIAGAIAGGYEPGRVVPSPVGGVMNTAETVKPVATVKIEIPSTKTPEKFNF